MRKAIRQNWQILWDHSSKCKQVKKLFDKVDEKRVLGDFYLNQIISGHGAFQIYQNRFFSKSPLCFCGKDEGTVEHTILKCDAWQDIRDTYFKKTAAPLKNFCRTANQEKEDLRWNRVSNLEPSGLQSRDLTTRPPRPSTVAWHTTDSVWSMTADLNVYQASNEIDIRWNPILSPQSSNPEA
ncbi:hypothetical protein AVEN_244525-1 [Araneus ventricosus]|uniref:Reverse transcriptase zinc-binding domain-containing protein n=1 Tax=Araneus ventricosus TaxID=182803 RepID=A0A4Y2F284_ARAVE|nr:hypothetical protein AVEN_244525-1 [Araneus ventricosus]